MTEDVQDLPKGLTRRQVISAALTGIGTQVTKNFPDALIPKSTDGRHENGEREDYRDEIAILSESIVRGEMTENSRKAMVGYANMFPAFLEPGLSHFQYQAGSRQFMLIEYTTHSPREGGENRIGQGVEQPVYLLYITNDNNNPLIQSLSEEHPPEQVDESLVAFRGVALETLQRASDGLGDIFSLSEDEDVWLKLVTKTGNAPVSGGESGAMYRSIEPVLLTPLAEHLGIVDGHLQGYGDPDSFGSEINLDVKSMSGVSYIDLETSVRIHCPGGQTTEGADIVLSTGSGSYSIGAKVERLENPNIGRSHTDIQQDTRIQENETPLSSLGQKRVALVDTALRLAVVPHIPTRISV